MPEDTEPASPQGNEDAGGDPEALVLSYMLPLPTSAPARNPWSVVLESNSIFGRVCSWIAEWDRLNLEERLQYHLQADRWMA